MLGQSNHLPKGKHVLSALLASTVLFSCSKDLDRSAETTSEFDSDNALMSTTYPITTTVNGALAFPGATGFAKNAKGAWAKYLSTKNTADLPKVMYVDNLNNDGAGSLRAALTASYPRVVIFRVGGTISLSSTIYISSPYLTIAGNTAPGGGIAVRGATISIRASEVIVRNIRVRNGVANGSDGIGVSATGSKLRNILIDHCSISWASDEQIGLNGTKGGVENLTIQNCLIAEGLKGHGFGLLANGAPADKSFVTNLSVHRNLFVSGEVRNPRFGTYATGTVINNLVHNWVAKASEYAGATSGDVLYNKFKPGKNTTSDGKNKAIQILSDGTTTNSKMYLAGNVNTGGTLVNAYPSSSATNNLSKTAFYTNSVYGFTPATDLTQLENELLATVGAFPRDPVDARLINEYKSGTGSVASSAGTYPTLAKGTYPANNNGVFLTWLVSKGYASSESAAQSLSTATLLNPANGKNGFSIMEEFISSLPPYNVSTSSTTTSSTGTTDSGSTSSSGSTSTTGSSTTASSTITSFVLVNAETEKDVMTISNGAVISLSKVGLPKLNIRANVSGSVGSVKFQLSGTQSKTYTDNAIPFALHGNNGTNYYYGNWYPPALGSYTLKATPYSGTSASGTMGAAQSISFTFVK